MFTNLNLSDMETCYKVFKGDLIRDMILTSKRFGIEPEMTAKILNVLESAMFQSMQKKQYAAVAANAKVLMRLIGLDTHDVNHNHRFKHGRSTAYY